MKTRPMRNRRSTTNRASRERRRRTPWRSTEQLLTVLDGVPGAIFASDRKGIITLHRGKAVMASGRRREDTVGRSVFDVYARMPEIVEATRLTLAGHSVTSKVEFGGVAFEFQCGPLRGENGEICGLAGAALDVTAHKASEETFRETHEMLQAVIQASPVGIVTLDLEGMVTSWNPAAARMHGWTEAAVLGRFLPIVPEDMQDDLMIIQYQIIAEGGVTGLEHSCVNKDGSPMTVSLSGAPLHDAAGNVTGVMYLLMDITARKRAEEQLQQQARSDVLTGLTNRRFFNECLAAAIALPRNRELSLGVLYLDLDGFKVVNETMGHASGDEILAQAAARLRQATGGQGVVSRIGGDEFAVIVEGMRDAGPAEELACGVRNAFRRPFEICGREVHATVSIGISLFPEFASSAPELVQQADTAMQEAKHQGKNKTVLYTRQLGAVVHERMELENLLRGSLDRGEISVHYQPEFSVKHQSLVCFEALARWNHPVLGSVPPLRFIPVAESCGFIVPLGLWILEQACARAIAWQKSGRPVKVAVNVSAVQFFRDDFVPIVKEVLARAGLAPSLLQIELTESVMLTSREQTVRKMHELRAMGVSLAVDDFGSGYSALSYLGKLPFTSLKIGRPFVQDLEDAHSGRMIETLVALAHNFDMSVVVEGVETDAQMDAVRTFGCDEVQGFLLGRPTPLPECFLEQSAVRNLVATGDLAHLSAVLTEAEPAGLFSPKTPAAQTSTPPDNPPRPTPPASNGSSPT
jgi:diguanylate cyclase (GGDEF)-like protein/PAS domain S-box-containing protein